MHASPLSSPGASAAPSVMTPAPAGGSPLASPPPPPPVAAAPSGAGTSADPAPQSSASSPSPVQPQGGRPGCPLCRPQGEDRLWQERRLRIIHVHDEAGQPAYFRVIWQAHVAEMTDLSDEDRQHLWTVLTLLESGVRRFLAPDKVNLASLGNQVPHLHWHISVAGPMIRSFRARSGRQCGGRRIQARNSRPRSAWWRRCRPCGPGWPIS